MSDAPYEFTGPYAGIFDNKELALDERHVYALYDILSAGGFKWALEIGCGYGASTSAFVESVKADPELRVVLCDPWMTQSVANIVTDENHDHERVKFFQGRSLDLLDFSAANNMAWDFLMVDGNHDLESVSGEYARIERIQSLRCIMAHDTSATRNGYPFAEGAEMLKRRLEESGWTVIEDAEFRLGEQTDRGLMAATREPELADLIREAFERRCPIAAQELLA